ncbi:MAG TPA: sugar ABC transporter permease [Thermomicrobiales bacterium]
MAIRIRAQEAARVRPVSARAPWWERNLAWLLVAPAIAMFALFAIYPTASALLFSLSRARLIRGSLERTYIGLDNFRRAFEDPLVRQSAAFTIKWSLSVTAMEVLLGLLIALLVSQLARGRGLITSLLIIPIIMPPVSVAVAWRFMYDPAFGIFNYLLNLVGLGDVYWLSDPDVATYALMAVDVWQTTPFVFLLLYAGLISLPRDPYEAAAIDGASPWFTFRTVTLPLLKPVLLVVILLRVIDSARIFDKILVMTRGGPGSQNYSMTYTIYQEFIPKFDFGYTAALSFLFQLSLVIVATIYVRRVMADYSAPAE